MGRPEGEKTEKVKKNIQFRIKLKLNIIFEIASYYPCRLQIKKM